MQSIKSVNLRNLRKCNQVWEEMIPNEKGRLCAQCENTIIDFRDLSQKEIAETHVFTEGKVCGLYREKQLKIEQANKRTSRLKPIYLTLVGMLSTTNLFGQEQMGQVAVKTEQLAVDNVNRKETSEHQNLQQSNSVKQDSVTVSGTVTDENGEQLIGVNVFIKGTSIGTTTDFNGFYFLNVTKQLEKNALSSLVFSYIGYETQEIVLNRAQIGEEKQITLDVSFEDSLEVTAFYVVEKLPLHKRIWRKMKRIFK